jgi:Fe(3+) dicitrate transport protein
VAILTGGDSGPDALVVRNNNRTYYGAGLQSVLGVSASSGAWRHQVELGVRYHQDEEDRFQQDDRYQMMNARMLLTAPGAPGSQANRVASATALAGFISDTVSWGNWSLAPGLRYEAIDLTRTDYAGADPERTGAAGVRTTDVNAAIPGIGFSYAPLSGIGLFGGIHRGFAPPGPGAAEGTEVEHSVNYELGTRIQRRRVRAEVVGFFNDYGNLLGRDTLAAGGSGEGELFNGGNVLVYGLEAAAHWDLAERVGLQSALPIRVSYTFTQAEFRNSFESQFAPWGSVQVGDELPYVPKHQFYASLETDHRTWRARVETFFVGRMRTSAGQGADLSIDSTDAYGVLNVSGEYRLRDDASLFVSVHNITDSVYVVGRHPAGARPGLPRLVQAGLKLSLGR